MAAKSLAVQGDEACAAPDGHRRVLIPDGMWKHWVLPVLLVSLVVLALLTSQAAMLCSGCLLGQLSAMSILVYRGSQTARDARYQTPVKNVVRSILGSLLLGAADVAMTCAAWDCLWPGSVQGIADVAACTFAALVLASSRVFFTFAACAVSDYMFHRFVWHAHWSQRGTSVLFRAVWRQYQQHYLGHHRHVHDPETTAKMSKLSGKPMSDSRKLTIEHASSIALEDQLVLWCSNHGLTLGTESDERVDFSLKWGCRLHTAMMFLTMPCGTLAILNATCGSLVGVLFHCTSSAFTLYLTFHHDKYHCSAEQRRRWVASRFAPRRGPLFRRWASCLGSTIWLCGGMDVVIAEHMKHHLSPEHREEFYAQVPYGRFFVYPMWLSW